MNDPRNVVDEFKRMSHDDIVRQLDTRGVELEIAIENTLRDFNMGTIVRTANAFGVRTVHVIGRKQWNKRGAMMTDKYLNVLYHSDPTVFAVAMKQRERYIVAVDNVAGSINLSKADVPKNSVFVFGQEGPGLSDELLELAQCVIAIEQFGSTRSINVGIAAGVAMYEWLRRYRLT